MKSLFEISSLEHTDIENIDKDKLYGLYLNNNHLSKHLTKQFGYLSTFEKFPALLPSNRTYLDDI